MRICAWYGQGTEMNRLLCFVMIAAAGTPPMAMAVEPKAPEFSELEARFGPWLTGAELKAPARLTPRANEYISHAPPFSFRYNGEGSRELLPAWTLTRSTRKIDEARTGHTLIYLDPATGLEVVCEATRYVDFPAIEWLLYFCNTAGADSPVIEDILPLDMVLCRPADGKQFTLHALRGGLAEYAHEPRAFEPLRFDLPPGEKATLTTSGGWSSNVHLPFFNVDAGGRGMVVGIGWSGQWSADLAADANTSLRIRAGMSKTHLRLHPGERIRSPRILIVFWEGDRLRGHNLLRQLIYRHHTPLLAGKKPLPPVQCNTWFPLRGGGNTTEQRQIELLEAYKPVGIEYLVMDAGWYGFSPSYPENLGSWTPRRDAFPNGLAPIGKAAKRVGIKYGMWFAPERVSVGTTLDKEHPEWLLKTGENSPRLLNLGLPEAERWFLDMVCRYIEEVPLDYFRHDFNMQPLRCWERGDTPDRVGMTEIRYTEALYRIWDALLARYPGMMIEGCCGGGRRIDLESISRCHTYWATDLYGPGHLTARQRHTYGASLYLPGNYLNVVLHAQDADRYALRSQHGCALCLAWDPREEGFDLALAVAQVEEFKALRHLAVGDFYPLLPYSIEPNAWIGYQFHRDDLDEGMALLFRREASPYRSVQIRLSGLTEDQLYDVTFADAGQRQQLSGRDLSKPMPVTIDKAPGSAIITYRAGKDTK